MRGLIILIMIFCFSGNGIASPDLENYVDIQGIRLYQDHLKKNTFYLTPVAPALATGNDSIPDAGLDIYRYLGRKGTSDSGKFWVKGVLSLGFVRDHKKKQLKAIKKVLTKTHSIKYPKLRSMPVSETRGKLIFADTNVQWSQGSRWSGKRLTLSLDEVISQILWEAVSAGQTLISVDMAETLVGVKKNKEKKWEKAIVEISSTVPIALDKAAYPTKFNQTDLGGRMVKGYTGIDIFCFDFLEQLDETLYSKVVEVAIPTPGKPLVETITFRQDSDCRTRIQFKLAKDLDTAYRVRITRIYNDGRSITGPWTNRMGEAMLDITDYKEDTQDLPPETDD